MSNSVVNGWKSHSWAISLIRLIALLMIITCHIMQHENYVLAWWLNVGVQIFLCISGYLYGGTDKRDVTEFYKSRFVKILIPYYIVYSIFVFVEVLFFDKSFSGTQIVTGVFCGFTIDGGEHLWFVGYILLCYVVTPLLHAYRDKYVKNSRSWIAFLGISVFIISVVLGLYSGYYNPAWIICYVIGYALGANRGYCRRSVIIVLFGGAAFVGNAIQIYVDYIICRKFVRFDTAYSYFKNYNHIWLGVFLFLVLLSIFEKTHFSECIKRALSITDKYGYETYLVHQFLIIGPMSLLGVTPFLGLDIVIIVIGIVVLTWLLKKVETLVLRIFD